jgi:hypothetical protein
MPTVSPTGPLSFSNIFSVVYSIEQRGNVSAAKSAPHPTVNSLFGDVIGLTGSTNSPYLLSLFRGYQGTVSFKNLRIDNQSNDILVEGVSVNGVPVTGTWPIAPGSSGGGNHTAFGTGNIVVSFTVGTTGQSISCNVVPGTVSSQCQNIVPGMTGATFSGFVVTSVSTIFLVGSSSSCRG